MIDHKKLAAAVVDVLPPPEKLGKSSDSGDESDGSDMGGEEAVKAFFSAGKSGDFGGAYKALTQAVKMCQDEDDSESN